jgi:hypothetical protein
MSEVKVSINNLTYSDAVVIEWALMDFIGCARENLTQLQHSKEEGDIPNRKERINSYQQRIKRGKYVLGLVSTAIDEVADNFMVEDVVREGDE